MKHLCAALLLVAAEAAGQAIHGGAGIVLPAPPAAEAIPVAGTFAGTRLVDNYRWLEDGASAATQEFVRAQNAYAARYLELAATRLDALDDLTDLESISTMSVPIARGETLFYTRRLAGETAESLYVSRPVTFTAGKLAAGKQSATTEKRLVDAGALSSAASLSLRLEDVSRDGTLVAFALVAAATGQARLRVVNAATGKLLEDELPAGDYRSVAFAPDGKGFYYARRSRQGTMLYLHRLSTRPGQDTAIFGREFRGEELGPDDSFTAQVSADGRYLVVTIERGTPARRTDIVFRDLTRPADPFEVLVWELEAHFSAEWAAGTWYVESDDQAPRGRICKADPGVLPEAWETVVPEAADPIESWGVAGGRLVVTRLHAGLEETSLLNLAGKPQGLIRSAELGRASRLRAGPLDRYGFYRWESPLHPPALYKLEIATGKTELLYQPRSSWDPAQYELHQLEVPAADGARLPLFVAGKKGLSRDAQGRLLLMALGGFGLPSSPGWSALGAWWLMQGGWVALATVRGGAESGIEFRQGALLDQRSQGYQDWFAAARFLAAEQYTAAGRIAMLGTARGDLLAGATLAWHPELAGAVASTDPVFDLLTASRPATGDERAAVSSPQPDPRQCRCRLADSAYHNMASGTNFPAVLLVSGERAGMDPLQAAKATALLQATSHSRRPVLLRSAQGAGRAGAQGFELQLQLEADRAAFLWTETEARPPAR